MTRSVHWFRGDLRLRDNLALGMAARDTDELACVFVLDDALLANAGSGCARVRFMLDGLARLARELEGRGQRLLVRRGDAAREIARLLDELRPDRLHFARDTTPAARRRDERVRSLAERRGVEVVDCKDRVVFEAAEVRTQAGGPFRVYTPYRRAWERCYAEDPPAPPPPLRLPPPPKPDPHSLAIPTAEELGFEGGPVALPTAGEEAARRRLARFLDHGLQRYPADRDIPALDGTSRLSPYLRFGMISVRECIAAAGEAAAADRRLRDGAEKWISELVWREFYSAFVEEHPHVLRTAYRSELAGLSWDDAPELLDAWREGRTGFPIVDAGMRQLRATGWMHNRVRMIAASFLAKDLLIDWKLGEAHFFDLLVDADPASNNGGWQWSASTGSDAQPYFRIFNPTSQGKRWDPLGDYVRRWVPELRNVGPRAIHEPHRSGVSTDLYPAPCVDHAERRVVALLRYQRALDAGRKGAAR